MPFAAAAEGDVAAVLLDLFAILLAAKLGDELFRRLGQPAIVGEILAGVLIGPSVLGLVQPDGVFQVFAELGVVFLLFWVGLETRLSDMRAVGASAAAVGVLGVVFPFAGGVALGLALGDGSAEAIFLGVSLVATSVGITSAVLIELGVLRTAAARTILGAAVIDDVLALLLLAVATGLASGGGLDVGDLALVLGIAVAFVAFVALVGTRAMQRWPRALHAPRFADSPLLPAVIVCLGLAALAAEVGLAAIVGAFLAGMIVAETREQHPIERDVAPLYAFFPPFFFAFIGAELDLGSLANGGALLLLAGLTALAIVTKYAGAWLGAGALGRRERGLVALGMIPRGEVGIIVAGIGASAGVVGDRRFAVIVAMSVATTLIAPPLLRRRLRVDSAASRSSQG
ncbi:MAG: cation:proton antiporter [Actinobacteria bacterium]|nr:cation:proton antiporter [Actinomycetota bacterium]